MYFESSFVMLSLLPFEECDDLHRYLLMNMKYVLLIANHYRFVIIR